MIEYQDTSRHYSQAFPILNGKASYLSRMHNHSMKIRSFLLLAFGLTWSIAAVGYFLGVNAGSGVPYMIVAGLAMLCPAIAAIVQQRVIDKDEWSGLGLPLKGTNWRIFIFTALVGLSIVPICLLVLEMLGDRASIEAFGSVNMTTENFVASMRELMANAGMPEIEGQFDTVVKMPAVLVLAVAMFQALIAALTVNLPFMLGEELGWRGYLFQRTQHWTGLRRVTFTGAIWGLWHAPLIMMGHNYPGYPIIGIGMMVIFCLLLAFLFDWTRSRSRSIWSSCVLHGIINGSAGAIVLFASGGHVLVGSVVGVAGFITIAILIAIVMIFDRQYREAFLEAQVPEGTAMITEAREVASA